MYWKDRFENYFWGSTMWEYNGFYDNFAFYYGDQNNLPKIIVVGKGNHSETDPVLRDNLPSFLQQLGLDYVLDSNNNGRLILQYNK